jgi:hypothetical protein
VKLLFFRLGRVLPLGRIAYWPRDLNLQVIFVMRVKKVNTSVQYMFANAPKDVTSPDSSDRIATGYGSDGRGSISRRGMEFVSHSVQTYPPIQWVPGAVSPD